MYASDEGGGKGKANEVRGLREFYCFNQRSVRTSYKGEGKKIPKCCVHALWTPPKLFSLILRPPLQTSSEAGNRLKLLVSMCATRQQREEPPPPPADWNSISPSSRWSGDRRRPDLGATTPTFSPQIMLSARPLTRQQGAPITARRLDLGVPVYTR